jgi:hypothetical protein
MIIPSNGGVVPDLQSDSLTPFQTQINGLVATPVSNQADARKLLNGEGLFSVAGDLAIPRGHIRVTPRTGAAAWSADANWDGVGPPGNAQIEIAYGGGAVGDSCYIEFQYMQSIDRTSSGI